MKYEATICEAALKTALNPRFCRPGSELQRLYLKQAAKAPAVIEGEMTRLEGIIRLLRNYLPDEKEEGR